MSLRWSPQLGLPATANRTGTGLSFAAETGSVNDGPRRRHRHPTRVETSGRDVALAELRRRFSTANVERVASVLDYILATPVPQPPPFRERGESVLDSRRTTPRRQRRCMAR